MAKIFRAALRGSGPAEKRANRCGRPEARGRGRAFRHLKPKALLVSETGERHLERHTPSGKRERFRNTPVAGFSGPPTKLFESVAGTEAPQGVAALFRQPAWNFDDVMRGRANLAGVFSGGLPLMLVMAAVQDPGNVGTIVRSAEAFGASGVVATRGTADPWSPKALRASAGFSATLAATARYGDSYSSRAVACCRA